MRGVLGNLTTMAVRNITLRGHTTWHVVVEYVSM